MAWSFFVWGLSEEYWDFVRWMERRTPGGRGGWRDAVGGTAKVPEGGEKGGRQRERISARARTPSGDTTKVP